MFYVAPGETGNVKVFELLLSGGADINRKYKDTTLLYIATRQNRSDTVKYLLDNGASPFTASLIAKPTPTGIKFEYYYQTPIDLAISTFYDNLDDEVHNLRIIFLLTEAMTSR